MHFHRCKLMKYARVQNTTMGHCQSNPVEDGSSKVVKVTGGLVEGFKVHTKEGNQCDVFLGIPYAAPPTGKRRFKKPEDVKNWEGVKKCQKAPNRSVHKEFFYDKQHSKAPQSEDCLYLNVFAPSNVSEKKYPVLFYIHGGGWMMDSAERYRPKNVCRLLVQKGVIVVTIHYRLGFLGFLCTGDESAQGNYGIWDMLKALQWTNNNIGAFGGDPSKITIAGQSAGGASADILSILPAAQGLFSQKILMGGNSFCSWSTVETDKIRNYCMKKAKRLGFKPSSDVLSKSEENKELVKFMHAQSSKSLACSMMFCGTIFNTGVLPLAPVVDGDLIPEPLATLREKAIPVPTIVGGGEHEMLLLMAIGMIKASEKDVEIAKSQICQRTGKDVEEMEKFLAKVYGMTPNRLTDSKLRKPFYVDLTSDFFANSSIYLSAKYSTLHSPECYLYSFDYQCPKQFGLLQFAVPFTGGTHTSEVNYLFNCNYMNSLWSFNETDKKVSEMTALYFTNFVKYGNPNSKDSGFSVWEPIDKNANKYQSFCFKEYPEMSTKPFMDRIEEVVLFGRELTKNKVLDELLERRI